MSPTFYVTIKNELLCNKIRNSRVTKSSYETELRKNLHFELLTRKFNFYFSTYELLTRS